MGTEVTKYDGALQMFHQPTERRLEVLQFQRWRVARGLLTDALEGPAISSIQGPRGGEFAKELNLPTDENDRRKLLFKAPNYLPPVNAHLRSQVSEIIEVSERLDFGFPAAAKLMRRPYVKKPQRYDGIHQMFVEEPHDLNQSKMESLRWDVENGRKGFRMHGRVASERFNPRETVASLEGWFPDGVQMENVAKIKAQQDFVNRGPFA